MKQLFEKWWCRNTKCFSIYNYRKAWKEAGVHPGAHFRTNGGKRKNGDRCFDASLTIGYTIFSYTNFDLQGKK